MKITDFPHYVLNDSWTKDDLFRVKSNISEIENELSLIKKNELNLNLNFTEEDSNLFSKLYSEMCENTLSLARLFQRYLILARMSEEEKISKISKLFQEDFYLLSALISEINENKIHNLVYFEYLKKLMEPYKTVILAFIHLINLFVSKQNNISSEFNDTKEFEDLMKELEV